MRKQINNLKMKPICKLPHRYMLISTLLLTLVFNSGGGFAEEVYAEELFSDEDVLCDTELSDNQLNKEPAADELILEDEILDSDSDSEVSSVLFVADDNYLENLGDEDIQGEYYGSENDTDIELASNGYAVVCDEIEVFCRPDQNTAQGKFTGKEVIYFETLKNTEKWIRVTFDTKDSLLKTAPNTGYILSSGILFSVDESKQLQEKVVQAKEGRYLNGVVIPIVQNYVSIESKEDSTRDLDFVGSEAIREEELMQIEDAYTVNQLNTSIDTMASIEAMASSTNVIELFVERNGINSLQLSWKGSEDADYYELYRMIDDGDWKKIKNVIGTTTSNLNLEVGHVYSYRIRERFIDGSFSEFSAVSSYLFENVLGIPNNVAVHKHGSSSAFLTWDTVEGAEQYVIYRSVNGGSWTKLKTVNESHAINYGLNTSTKYAFKIYAYSSNGGFAYSDFSNSVELSLSTELEAPTISVIQYGLNTAALKWEAIDNAIQYNIYRSDDGGNWKKIKSSTGTYAYNYSLKENISYSYRVNVDYEINGVIETSDFSNVVVFQLGSNIGIPENINISRVSDTCAEISWTPLTEVSGYALYRCDDGNTWKKIKDVEGEFARNYRLVLGSMYSYYLRGYKEGEFGRYYGNCSEVVNYWNSGPITIHLDNSAGKNCISWESLTEADYYNVYLDNKLYATTTAIDYMIDDSGEVTVTACQVHGQEVFETDKSNSIEIEKVININHRALLIGETTYAQKLNGPENDVAAMKNILMNLHMGYEVYSQIDASKEEIIDLIDIAFSDATEDDISLFYYSGHGITGAGEYYSGAIQTVDYQYITIQDLAELLSGVPGKIIVIMDSCGSGATISDEEISAPYANSLLSANDLSESYTKEDTDNEIDEIFDAEKFSKGVIEAFKPYYLSTGTANADKSGSGRAMELRTSKFYVLTGSAYEESSLTTNNGGYWGGLFTKGLTSCAGFTYPTSSFAGSFAGDFNDDNLLSLAECAAYCTSFVDDRQHILSYPSNSDFVLFFNGEDKVEKE
ncbi:MAG: caspase family protein [Bacteroides sp.]|nr:caspase family protein [Bacteroides sp.]